MPTIETRRIQFHYRTHGDPDGLPMLLLHGNFATSRWWEPFFAILPDSIYAVAPDLRGCGGSTKSADGYTIQEQAEDVAAFVDALGLEDFDLVGHSSSGAIAIEYALQNMHRLRSLILINSAPVEGVFTPLEGLRMLAEMRNNREMLGQALAMLMPAAPPSTMEPEAFEVFFQQLVEDALQMAPAAFTGIAEALDQWNRFTDVGRLSLPSLLVWGDQDTIVDRDATTRMLIAIPGANNLEVLRGVGHSPMIESPVVLAERIIDFISEDFEEYAEARQYAEENASQPDDRDR